MKKISLLILICLFSIFVACTSTPTPKGFLYTGCKGPFYATSNEKSEKVGKSSAQSVLGILAWGDASTETAAKNAGITKIHHADYEDKLYFFGIYSKYTVVVYGE